MPKNER